MNTPSTRRNNLGWGWSLTIIALVCIIVALGVLFVMHQQALRVGSMRQIHCLNRLNIIGVAMEMYASDWGDTRLPLHTTDQRAPDGKSWPDLLVPYLKKIDPEADSESLAKLFRCPDSDKDLLSYSLNPRIAGLYQGKIKYPSTTICAFDSVNDLPANNNLHGDTIWRWQDGGMPQPGQYVPWDGPVEEYTRRWPKWAKPRHEGGSMVLFADGHVKDMSPGDTPRFEPKAKEE